MYRLKREIVHLTNNNSFESVVDCVEGNNCYISDEQKLYQFDYYYYRINIYAS